MRTLTAEHVRSILEYNPETGVFTWRDRPASHFKNRHAMNIWNSQHAGKTAGCTRHDGYLLLGIHYKLYLAHRIAWLWMTGVLPDEIDHVDCNKSNLRWTNLRIATHPENGYNQGRRSDNTSGFKGVYWNKHAKKWQAYITVDKKTKYLGLFLTAESAFKARNEAAELLHGEFARAA